MPRAPKGKRRMIKYVGPTRAVVPASYVVRARGPRVVPGYTQTSGFYGRFANRPGELKFFDLDVDDAVIVVDGQIQTATGSINTIAQGVTEVTRVGRKCRIKSILWRYNLELVQGATVGLSETVRCIVYQDTQCNGATAAVTDILESDNYQSFNNLANSGRFRILYDKTHVLNPSASAGNGTANDVAQHDINRAFYKKCDIPIEFSATTGAITEIRSNNLCILTVSKTGGLAAMDSKIRLRFSDN